MAIFLADDPLFDEHRARGYHPERPERLVAARRAVARVEEAGLAFERLAPRDATRDELARAHDEPYLDALAAADGRWAALDPDTFLGPRSVLAARRAAGAALSVVESVLDAPEGGRRLGVAIVRPPGHHATPARGMGFCLLNNVAVAAHAALARGLERVAIVDWDVHHGNGTQDAFWRDGRVLYVSLHQWPLYPGTGSVDEVGAGDAKGFIVNVPLSEHAGDATYASAFERIVEPALSSFAPELVLVSAGFDAHRRDPLAAMDLDERAYAAMATAVGRIADASAGGRVALLLEGGYDLAALEASLAASILALAGAPADALMPSAPIAPVDPRHAREIDDAARAARRSFPAV